MASTPTIRKPGLRELTTQMYFEGEQLNAQDGVLMRLTPADRAQVIVRFEDADFEEDAKVGVFDITMN